MVPRIFAPLFVTLMMLMSISSAYGASISAVPEVPGDQVYVGDFNGDIGLGIKGQLDRSVPFEVVPGEDFTFDMLLKNLSQSETTSHVEVILYFPNSYEWTFLDENVTLQGGESSLDSYDQYVPNNLEMYGRYTCKLFIDNCLADFFQFDMNSRSEIIVRWDDGVLANAYAWYDADSRWAIRGCMPQGSVLTEIGVHVLAESDVFWPWPDDIHQPIEVELFDQDGPGGLPGTLLWMKRITPGATGDVVITCTYDPPTAGFYVSNHQITAYPECEGQGVDDGLNHPDQMFAQIAGEWQEYTSISGDLMIWAKGQMLSGEMIVIGNPPTE